MKTIEIIGLVNIIVGLLSFLFRNQIISIQGPSKKSSFSLKERKQSILVGSIGLIFLGLMMLFNVRDLLR